MPALEARRVSAQARAQAATAVLAGELQLVQGFPHLRGTPLGSRAWLAASRGRLDRAAQARMADAALPAPDLPGEEEGSAWRAALEGAWAAEEEADALERRLLLALDAQLLRVPELGSDALEAWRSALGRRRAAAEAQHAAAADPEARAAAELELSRLVEDGVRMEALVELARAVALKPGRMPAVSPDELARVERGDQEATRRLELRQRVAPDDLVADALAGAPPEPTPTPAPTPPPVEPDTVSAELQATLDEAARRAQGAADRAAAAETQGRFDASMRHDEVVGAQAKLAELASAHRKMLAISSLDPRRRHDAAEAYREAHDLLTSLRQGALDAGHELVSLQSMAAEASRRMDAVEPDLESARVSAAALEPGAPLENILANNSRWAEAVAREASATHTAAAAARTHRDQLLAALRTAKELRRRLAEHAPPHRAP